MYPKFLRFLWSKKPTEAENESHVSDLLSRARALQQRGQFQQSALTYQLVLELDPGNWEALDGVAAGMCQSGDLEKAIALYDAVIDCRSDHALAYYKRGNALNGLRRWEAALADYDRALSLEPAYAHALCNRGFVLERLGRHDEALNSYDRALAVDAGDHLAFYNRGGVLATLHRHEEALASYERAIHLKNDYVDAHILSGNLLHKLGRYDAAVARYDRAITAAPHAESLHWVYVCRGMALAAMTNFEAALNSYDQAIARKQDSADAYFHRGNAMMSVSRFEDAANSYQQSIDLGPKNVLLQSAHASRGLALRKIRRFEDALESYERAIAMNPDEVELLMDRGGVLQELTYHRAAVESYDLVISLQPDHAEAHRGRAFSLLVLHQPEAAAASFGRSLKLNPDQKYLLGFQLFSQMQVCEWSENTKRDVERLVEALREGKPVCAPFQALALTDLPLIHKLAAEMWTANECPSDPRSVKLPIRDRDGKIRLGYFSADFHDHPVSQLAAELFELHDREQFEITAFSLGPDTHDSMRERLKMTFDRFVDARYLSDIEVVTLARTLSIDIAIDLNGFTQNARTGIFALRVAPIQVNYLGYPGTMGAEYMDYMIADGVVAPVQEKKRYVENIVRLPNCFLPNDSTRSISKPAFTRDMAGLPSDKFVYCCFNNSFKVSPAIFEVWIRILHRVKSSVLWMSSQSAVAMRNLKLEAERRGVSAQRLVFAQRLKSPADHLARIQAADLFLDTLPYNAHATAVDAVWAGLPLLTCTGSAFPGRVGTSLLSAMGVPELITSTLAEYEDMAVQLAEDPGQLQRIRQTLLQNRLTTPLFNTPEFTRNLESAYSQMYSRYQGRLAPQDISILR